MIQERVEDCSAHPGNSTGVSLGKASKRLPCHPCCCRAFSLPCGVNGRAPIRIRFQRHNHLIGGKALQSANLRTAARGLATRVTCTVLAPCYHADATLACHVPLLVATLTSPLLEPPRLCCKDFLPVPTAGCTSLACRKELGARTCCNRWREPLSLQHAGTLIVGTGSHLNEVRRHVAHASHSALALYASHSALLLHAARSALLLHATHMPHTVRRLVAAASGRFVP